MAETAPTEPVEEKNNVEDMNNHCKDDFCKSEQLDDLLDNTEKEAENHLDNESGIGADLGACHSPCCDHVDSAESKCETEGNDCCLSLGTLKKDDSGIDMEKSPTNTSMQDGSMLSDMERSESVSESLTDSAAISWANSASEVNLKQDCKLDEAAVEPLSDHADVCFSVDSGDSGENELASGTELLAVSTDDESSQPPITASSKSSPDSGSESRKRRYHQTDSSSNDSNNDVADDSRRQRSNILDSDDDDDDDDEDKVVDSEMKDKKSECESEEDSQDMVLDDTRVPKHIWHAVPDLLKRECGFTNKVPPSFFREKVQGSLQMVQRFHLQYKMNYHEGCVNALHFNRIGTLLASGSDDLNIVLWNWIRNRPALVYDSGHRSNVFQAKFMPFSGDCHVVSCARDGQIRLAELSLTGVCKGTKKLAQHRGAAHKLALEMDSPHVFLSCGEDALIYEIDLRQDKPNKMVITKENDRKVALYSIQSNPSNSVEFCVGGRDHFIRVYDKRKIAEQDDGGVLKKFCPHHLINSDIKANVTCSCYNYNGTEIMGSYNDEDIYLFNNLHSDGADHIHRFQGHRNNQTVKGVNFYGPKSEFIVSGSDCGNIFLWDKETEKIVQFMEGDEGGVINVLEPHPFAPVLATSGLDHDVKIWSPTAEEPTDLKGLKKIMKKNRRERDEERTNDNEMLDGQMLWFIMHHIRRARRRQAGQEAEEEVSSNSEHSDTESESEPEEMPERFQCNPS